MTAIATAVLFIVYLNVPAVAVRDFGVPFIAGALIPLLLVVPFLYRVVARGEPLKVPALFIAAAIMLCLQGLSALFAVHPHESFQVVQDWALEGVLLAALIVNVFVPARM